MNVLERLEIALAELGLVVPVADLALARERLRGLKLGGPDRGIGEVRRTDRPERQRRVARGIPVAGHRVDGAVRLPAGFLADEPAVSVEDVAAQLRGVVLEHVAGVIEDDVEDHADAVRVRRADQRDQIVARAEARIDVEEVLDAVAVVRLLRRHLLEDRADPDGRDPETLEIADFRLEPAQRPAHEPTARLHPVVPIRGGCGRVAAVRRLERRRRAGRDDGAVIVPIALLASVREAIEHQEIEDLVFPGRGRGKERSSRRERGEVDVGDALLHGTLPPFRV